MAAATVSPWSRRRFAVVAVVVLLAPPAWAQWRVEQGGVSSGAAAATSPSHVVQGCVDHQPAGVAASASYTVYSGCGAAAVQLQGEGGPGPGGPGGPGGAPEVPSLTTVGSLALLVALGLLGVSWLRRLTPS